MELSGVVFDKNGHMLSEDELKSKVINTEEYYDVVLPIRKKIRELKEMISTIA